MTTPNGRFTADSTEKGMQRKKWNVKKSKSLEVK